MKNFKQEPKIEKSKEVELIIHELEKDSVIVNIQGWRMRVYFDSSLSKEQKEQVRTGQSILVKYFGDIEDVHTLKLLPLK